MKLSLKLPLAFAGSISLLLAGALFGIYQLNRAVTSYEDDVLHHVAANKKAAETIGFFAVAIQEWKNVLLRGKDPKELEKYWDSHSKEMKKVSDGLSALQEMLTAANEKKTLDKLSASLALANEGYKKAFEEFKTSGGDAAIGDKAARGKDREAVALMTELQKQLSKAELDASSAAYADAKAATSLAISTMLVVAILTVVAAFRWSRQITNTLNQAVDAASKVANGDLSNVIHASGSGELGALLASLHTMQAKLADTVYNVRQGSESVSTASAEIALGNNDLSARTESQASALEQTAASMEELSATVKQNADNARQANQLALSASTVAVQGGEVVAQVVDTMKGINDASRKIADIISVIDGIAFQTNILALNAAVEAARAGEQGRGFAVVASEVRALAGRSAEAAKEIKTLINTSVQRVEQGTTLVDQAGITMNEVVTSIKRVTDIMGEISAASSEQSQGVSQVGEAVTQMDQVTQQNAALVEEMAAAASSLKSQAQELVQTVAVFKLGADKVR
jgi:methyl-accepting chemotaxis protein